MSKLTLVTYCHEAHSIWVEHWLDQVSKQDLEDFKVLFIQHNWKDWQKANDAEIMIRSRLRTQVEVMRYKSEPVIGDVIDHAARVVDTEYFAHHDIDDIFHPSRLRLQLEYLEANPDVDFLNARCMGFTGDEPEEWPDLFAQETTSPLVAMLTHPKLQSHEQIGACFSRGFNCLSHGVMVYRPEILEKIGGFSRSDVKKDGLSPDFETWKKAYMAGYKFHRLPELLMMWRLDSSSIRL